MAVTSSSSQQMLVEYLAKKEQDEASFLQLVLGRSASSQRSLHMISSFMPKYTENAFDMDAWTAVYARHLPLLQLFVELGISLPPGLAVDAASTGSLAIVQWLRTQGIDCANQVGADCAAARGYLDVVRDLRDNGIHCTSKGANDAARNGKLEVVRDLREHGILCTSGQCEGPNWVACFGHLEILRELEEVDGLHCTWEGAVWAVSNGQLDTYRYVRDRLRQRGEECSNFFRSMMFHSLPTKGAELMQEVMNDFVPNAWTSTSADRAATQGNLEMVRDLRAKGIHCNTTVADEVAYYGHLSVMRDLRAHGIRPSWHGLARAVCAGHLEVVKDILQTEGYGLTSSNADGAAKHGQLDMVRYLRSLGIHCTSEGADGAAYHGHIHVVSDLADHGIYCPPTVADRIATGKVEGNGRCGSTLEMIRHLAETQDIHCTSEGLARAALCRNIEVFKYLVVTEGMEVKTDQMDGLVWTGVFRFDVLRMLIGSGIYTANDMNVSAIKMDQLKKRGIIPL